MKYLHPEDAVLLPCPDHIPNCEALPVVIRDGESTSFWQPEPAELDALNAGGSLMLTFPGLHPVIRVEATSYPAIMTDWPIDEQLNEVAKMRFGSSTVPPMTAFKAGARWQAARAHTEAEIDAAVYAVVKNAREQMGVQLTRHGYERYKKDHPEGYNAIRATILVALGGIATEKFR